MLRGDGTPQELVGFHAANVVLAAIRDRFVALLDEAVLLSVAPSAVEVTVVAASVRLQVVITLRSELEAEEAHAVGSRRGVWIVQAKRCSSTRCRSGVSLSTNAGSGSTFVVAAAAAAAGCFFACCFLLLVAPLCCGLGCRCCCRSK